MSSLNMKIIFIEYENVFVEYENIFVEYCYIWATIPGNEVLISSNIIFNANGVKNILYKPRSYDFTCRRKLFDHIFENYLLQMFLYSYHGRKKYFLRPCSYAVIFGSPLNQLNVIRLICRCYRQPFPCVTTTILEPIIFFYV